MAGALGPFLGGWLVQVASWRLVFLINVPLAALVVIVALRHVPESRDPAAPRRPRRAGGADRRARAGRADVRVHRLAGARRRLPQVLVALALGVAGLVGFVLVERRSPQPMLPL